MSIAGHIWTLAYGLRGVVQRKEYRDWSWRIERPEPLLGELRLTGLHDTSASRERLLVVLHGLGGSALSHYAARLAAVASGRGWSCLRLNARGSDRGGRDFYHAALTEDLRFALGSEPLAGYSEIALAGFSLGGHVVLRYLTEPAPDPRLVGAVTFCSPLDLDACATRIDEPSAWPYRRFLLSRLKEIYRLLRPERDDLPPLGRVETIRTLREWDEIVVAPRHGFAGAADYYARASAGPRLGSVETPALFIASRSDPMVPASSLEPSLAAASTVVEPFWMRGGGHVALPGLDLELQAPLGPEGQSLAWLEARSARG